MIPLVLFVLASHGHHKSELTRSLEVLDRVVQVCLPEGGTGGRLKVSWEITSTGQATALFADRVRTTLHDDAVIDCVVEKIQDFSFPTKGHDRKVSRTFHLGQTHKKHRRKKRAR
jgi:hypothetical protein